MKKIGLLTSGGDAPGMNSVIRSVVRTASKNDLQVCGIKRGYEGLLSGDVIDLTAKSVSDISDHGGTMLLSARCEEMRSEAGLKRAYEMSKIFGLDALIVIGGDGTITGASLLNNLGLPVIGIPGTIDLDLDCSEYTIGFDTAINTGVDAISKVQDTTFSHERVSIVEVMGRNCGALAIWCAIATGADDVLVPEVPDVTHEDVIRHILSNRSKGKRQNIIIFAEGYGKSHHLVNKIEDVTGISSRATVLGHIQRGGAPSALDRFHGSNMGSYAVNLLLQGEQNRIVIVKGGKYDHIDIHEGLAYKKPFDMDLYNQVRKLSI